MADTQIRGLGTGSAPLSYTVPGAQEIVLKSLFANFDGTSAAGSYLPCVRIVAPGGGVVGEYITDTAVAAGSSAEVSFAPFLSRGGAGTSGGIPIVTFAAFEQAAGFLTITSTNFAAPTNIVTSGSFTANGTDLYLVTFSVSTVDIAVTVGGTGTSLNLQLLLDTTILGIVANFNVDPAGGTYGSIPVNVSVFDTPAAGSHTYSIGGVKGLTGGAAATMRIFGSNAGSPFDTVTHPGFIAVQKITITP